MKNVEMKQSSLQKQNQIFKSFYNTDSVTDPVAG